MRELLKKHEWLFFPILIVSMLQAFSALMFFTVNFDVAYNYIFNGVFQYSETPTRALVVAGFMQIPAIVFWLIIFIISIRRNKCLKMHK